MKKILLYVSLAAVAAVMASCNKQDNPVSEPVKAEAGEIVFSINGGFEAEVETKADALTAVPTTVYWGATTGANAAGSATETVKWATASATPASGKVKTGKYQTATPTAYTYYVANQTFTAGGNMTVANNNTDIVAGRTVNNNTTTPAVALNHIFARTGSLTCNTASGFTISNVSWKIVGKGEVNGTAGVFNMKTQSWSSASTKLSSQTDITSSSDMYLLPGTYTIYVTYTLTKGDNVHTYTKHADVTLVQGKVNNITCTAVSDITVSEIQISLSLSAWGTNNITIESLAS